MKVPYVDISNKDYYIIWHEDKEVWKSFAKKYCIRYLWEIAEYYKEVRLSRTKINDVFIEKKLEEGELILKDKKDAGGDAGGEKDNINPQHYKLMGGLQVIDIIDFVCKDLSGEKGYCLGNALKYLMRSNKKGVMLEDIKKAEWYVKRLIGYLEGERI